MLNFINMCYLLTCQSYVLHMNQKLAICVPCYLAATHMRWLLFSTSQIFFIWNSHEPYVFHINWSLAIYVFHLIWPLAVFTASYLLIYICVEYASSSSHMCSILFGHYPYPLPFFYRYTYVLHMFQPLRICVTCYLVATHIYYIVAMFVTFLIRHSL